MNDKQTLARVRAMIQETRDAMPKPASTVSLRMGLVMREVYLAQMDALGALEARVVEAQEVKP